MDPAYTHHISDEILDAHDVIKLLESRFNVHIEFSFRKRNYNSATIQVLSFDEFIHDLDDKACYWIVVIDKTNPFHNPAYFHSRHRVAGPMSSVSCNTPARAIKDMIDILMHDCLILFFDKTILTFPAFSSFLEMKMSLDIYGKDSFISKAPSTCIERFV